MANACPSWGPSAYPEDTGIQEPGYIEIYKNITSIVRCLDCCTKLRIWGSWYVTCYHIGSTVLVCPEASVWWVCELHVDLWRERMASGPPWADGSEGY